MDNIVANAVRKQASSCSREYRPSSGEDERFIRQDQQCVSSVPATLPVLVTVEAAVLLDEGIDTEDILPVTAVAAPAGGVGPVEVSWISDMHTKFEPVPLDNLIQGFMANVLGEIVTSPAVEGKWVTLSIRQEDLVIPVILPRQSHQILVADFKRMAYGGPMMMLITHVVPCQQLGLSNAMLLVGHADSVFELQVDNVHAADLINEGPEETSRLRATHKAVRLSVLSSNNSRASSTVVVDAFITDVNLPANYVKYKCPADRRHHVTIVREDGNNVNDMWCVGCNQLIVTAALQLSVQLDLQADITSFDHDVNPVTIPISTPGIEAMIRAGNSESAGTFAEVFNLQADPHEANATTVGDMFKAVMCGKRWLLLVLRSNERNTIIGAEELDTPEGQVLLNAAEAAAYDF